MTNVEDFVRDNDYHDSLYTPTTEQVRADYCLLADVSRPRQLQFDRWLAEVKREVWDDAVNQVIATVRCDSEDVTWVNKNPYRQGEEQ